MRTDWRCAARKVAGRAVTSAAGLALWVVNFQVVARALGWPWFPDGPNAVVQILAYTVFFAPCSGFVSSGSRQSGLGIDGQPLHSTGVQPPGLASRRSRGP